MTTMHVFTFCTVPVGCLPSLHSLHHHPLLLLHLSFLGATGPGGIFPDHNVTTMLLLALSTLEYYMHIHTCTQPSLACYYSYSYNK